MRWRPLHETAHSACGLVARLPVGVCVFALTALHVAMLAAGAVLHSPTIDEPGEVVAGVHFWRTGNWEINVCNGPLVNQIAAIPVLLSGPDSDWTNYPAFFQLGQDFMTVNQGRSFWLVTLARWACIPFSVLGALVSFRWAKELYGNGAGLSALMLWIFCPDVIGQGQLVKCDIAAASIGLAAFYSFAKWLEDPTKARAATAGALLGLAQLTKYVWIVMGPAWILLWLASRLSRNASTNWRRDVVHWLLIVSLAICVLNMGYGFAGTFRPLARSSFLTRAFAPEAGADKQVTAPPTWLAYVPVPLPSPWLRGFDHVASISNRATSSSPHGATHGAERWYFYIVGWAIKLPLGTCLIFLLACACTIAGAEYCTGWKKELPLLVPFVVVLTFVSIVTTVPFLRYAMPALPFAFVWSSKVATAFVLKHRLVIVLASASLAWSVGSSLAAFPHSLSYFNELIGGPDRGPEYLLHDSSDWGQDLFYLKDWVDSHPAAHPFFLAYFGPTDPRDAGIDFRQPPITRLDRRQKQRHGTTRVPLQIVPNSEMVLGTEPGWYAISATLLYGFPWTVPDGRGRRLWLSGVEYRHFQRVQPVAKAGYSIYIYYISVKDANRARKALGLDLLKE